MWGKYDEGGAFGGGSSYTPELVMGFLDRIGSFPHRRLRLADISQERLGVVGGFAERMAAAAGAPFKVVLTPNQQDAIRGASYVMTQLRVGGMQARRDDEYLGKRHGLIGQERTGVGGMAKALRTIPVILGIATTWPSWRRAHRWSTSPTQPGWSPRRWSRYAPEVTAVGVCNVPITAKMRMVEVLERRTGRKLDPVKARAGHAGAEPSVVAPRLHLRGRGLLAGDLRRLPGRAPRRPTRRSTPGWSRCWGRSRTTT